MNHLEIFAKACTDKYSEIAINRPVSIENKVNVLQLFYEKFYPSKLVERFRDFNGSFKEYYDITAKNKKSSALSTNFTSRNSFWLVKPEAYFLNNEVGKYLKENVGNIVDEGTLLLDKEDLTSLYEYEMSYPIYSNLVSGIKEIDVDVIYSLILRVSSFLAAPSYAFVMKSELTHDLEEFSSFHKKNIRNTIVKPSLDSMGIRNVLNNPLLMGLDPILWSELDPGWVQASYNGIHSPSSCEELNKCIELFYRIKI